VVGKIQHKVGTKRQNKRVATKQQCIEIKESL